MRLCRQNGITGYRTNKKLTFTEDEQRLHIEIDQKDVVCRFSRNTGIMEQMLQFREQMC